MNDRPSPLIAIGWVLVAMAFVVLGWRRGNWVAILIGALMIAVGAWNTAVLYAHKQKQKKAAH
jgi:uncharacterized membrane protein